MISSITLLFFGIIFFIELNENNKYIVINLLLKKDNNYNWNDSTQLKYRYKQIIER